MRLELASTRRAALLAACSSLLAPSPAPAADDFAPPTYSLKGLASAITGADKPPPADLGAHEPSSTIKLARRAPRCWHRARELTLILSCAQVSSAVERTTSSLAVSTAAAIRRAAFRPSTRPTSPTTCHRGPTTASSPSRPPAPLMRARSSSRLRRGPRRRRRRRARPATTRPARPRRLRPPRLRRPRVRASTMPSAS